MSTPPDHQAMLRAGEPAFREFLTAVVLHGQAAADAAGLGMTDFYALNLLGAFGPLTAGELAERTGLTTGATTRLIDRLERDGYARRSTAPGDRRKVRVELAPERAGRRNTVITAARRHLADVFTSYATDDLELLFGFFTRAAAALRATVSETRLDDESGG